MKLKNVKVGQRVQIKDVHKKPTLDSSFTAYQYGVNIEEHVGVVVREPDSDGDVRVAFEDWFEHQTTQGRDYLYVHHSKLRKVK